MGSTQGQLAIQIESPTSLNQIPPGLPVFPTMYLQGKAEAAAATFPDLVEPAHRVAAQSTYELDLDPVQELPRIDITDFLRPAREHYMDPLMVQFRHALVKAACRNEGSRVCASCEDRKCVPALAASLRKAAPEPEVSSPAIRVLVAAREFMLREGLSAILEPYECLHVAGTLSSTEAVLKALRETSNNVLLLDTIHPMEGFDKILEAAPKFPATKIILVARDLTQDQMIRALRGGVRGIVSTDEPGEWLTYCIRKVHGGEYYMSNNTMEQMVKAVCDPGEEGEAFAAKHGLTDREAEMLKSIVDEGMSNAELAKVYGVSLQTVKHHVSSILDKTGAGTRLELAVMASQHKSAR